MKSILLAIAAVVLVWSNGAAQTAPASSPVAIHGSLKTSGNRIVDQNNTVTSLAGMSFFWSQWSGQYYNSACVDWLVSDWNCQIVRAAMGVESNEGYLNFPDVEKQKVFTIVDAAIRNGIYVLIDWHEENAIYHQAQAIAFFKEMATKYGAYPNVIYEIYNEPVQYSWDNQLKPYSQALVDEIRKIDPDNLIIIGNRDWDQHPVECANNPVSGTNIAYTLHFYVGTHFQDLRNEAKAALDKGIPLFVTEWGVWGSTAELDTWVTFMRDNKLSWCNWSVINKDEPSSSLKTTTSATSGWADADLTDLGYKVREYIRGWAPKPCNTLRQAYKTNQIPGTIEAEDYDNGCAGVAFYDTESSNKGGKYRTDAVDIEACTDTSGGYNVGYIEDGEWLEYTLNAVASGKYTINLRVASNNSTVTKQANIFINNQNIGTISVNNTTGWQTWQTVSLSDVTISGAANAVLRLQFVGGQFNVNNITFTQQTSSQTINLSKGWNLIATNIQANNNSIATIFANLPVQEIKTMNTFWNKTQAEQFNTLKTIDAGVAYLVNMNNAATLTIQGNPIQMPFIASPQASGWNLIAATSTETFSTFFDATNCSVIKNFEGFWIPNGTANTISGFEPTKGFFIKK